MTFGRQVNRLKDRRVNFVFDDVNEGTNDDKPGGREMRNKRVFLLSLAVLLLSSSLALADCVSLASFTDWYAQDSHNIVFYRGPRPLGTINVPNCSVKPSSTILLNTGYVCDSDKIIIDGEECTIMTVTSAAF